jgi:hypothetical protein
MTMKKIVLTTEQMDKINEYVSSEGETKELNESLNNERYEMKCEIDFNYRSDLMYKGQEIEDIENLEYNVNYLIESEHRSWGIKSISVYDVQGPEELELYIQYYPEGSDDITEVTVPLKIDWDAADYDHEDPRGIIGIDKNIEIELVNDSDGNIVAQSINIITYSL